MLTTKPLLVLRLRKSRAIPPLTLWVILSLLRGSLYLYLYQPYVHKSVCLLFENIPKGRQFLSTDLGSCMHIVHVVTGIDSSIAISAI